MIRLPEMAMGLIPGAGGTVSITPPDRPVADRLPRPERPAHRRADRPGLGLVDEIAD
ncbi:MAG: hypothetical protein ACR2MP_23080 [Streptosporangiaceae bacterium]